MPVTASTRIDKKWNFEALRERESRSQPGEYHLTFKPQELKVPEIKVDLPRYPGLETPVGRTAVSGAYLPYQKTLVLWRSNESLETLRHEAFHQFMDYCASDPPPWFSEGMATYFETSWAAKPVRNEKRAAEAQRASNPGLRRLLLMSAAEFDGGDSVSERYALSWSFVHFLATRQKKPVLDRYFLELAQGRDAAQAFESVFGREDLGDLERRWQRFVAAGAK